MKIFLFLIVIIASLNAKKVALLIGNQNYENYPKLYTPINDIKEMQKLLESKGFETISLNDSTQREMQKNLYIFREKTSNSDISLFYYSGHGIAINDKNYLIPIDSPNINQKSSHYYFLPLDKIIHFSSYSQASIILINASRYFPTNKKNQRGLIQPNVTNRNTILTFSTSIGKTTDDKNHSFSIFGKFLINNFSSFKDIRLAIENTKREITEESNYTQIPYIIDTYPTFLKNVPEEIQRDFQLLNKLRHWQEQMNINSIQLKKQCSKKSDSKYSKEACQNLKEILESTKNRQKDINE